jgi:drug/metabolite transporter (DMT)-like permease
LGLAELITIR